jgi:hypothetical protein
MHCHAKFATMFALTRQPIPACIEEFDVYVGGDVEVADYKTTGTEELEPRTGTDEEDAAYALRRVAELGALASVSEVGVDAFGFDDAFGRDADVMKGPDPEADPRVSVGAHPVNGNRRPSASKSERSPILRAVRAFRLRRSLPCSRHSWR